MPTIYTLSTTYTLKTTIFTSITNITIPKYNLISITIYKIGLYIAIITSITTNKECKMPQNKTTAKAAVFSDLNKRVEHYGPTEVQAIHTMSISNIDAYTTQFLANNSFKFNKPIKSGTINRYVELWLKKQLNSNK